MANHKDAIKRIRQNAVRRARNRHFRSRMRNQIKHLRTVIEAGDHAAAMTEFSKTVGIIQRNVTKGIIHRNQAARSISRLNKAVKSLSS